MESKVNKSPKITATPEQFEEMLNYYEGYLAYSASPYIVARAKLSDATITFYKTNTVLFQGESDISEYNIWAKKFNIDVLETSDIDISKYAKLSAIGSDEVGTGDYYGPIVVCSSYVNASMIEQLSKLGVKDSKLLTDNQILEIGFKLIKLIPYSLIYLRPEKYNGLSEEHSNLNFIKAYLHNKVLLSLKNKLNDQKVETTIVDEFTPIDKYFEYLSKQPEVYRDIECIQKGERAHIAVAAASIIARFAFLKEIKDMSNNYKFNFLKGASHEVDRSAISFVKSFGWDELSKVAKVKYANTERLVEYFKENPLPKSKIGSFNKQIGEK